MIKPGIGHVKACVVFLFFIFCFTAPARADTVRVFNDLFPGLDENRRYEVFTEDGLIRIHEKNPKLELIPSESSGVDLLSTIMKSNPVYFAESLIVIPYSGRTLNKLDIFNTLGQVRELKGIKYYSHTRKTDIPLFTEATRIENGTRNRPIPDPEPAAVLPPSDTMYVLLKDYNFGNCYFKCDVTPGPYGMTYYLTNTRNMSFLIFTVIKEEKFSATMYAEPLAEGMLLYIVAGADVPNFIGNRIDVPYNIAKRGAIFLDWASAGFKSIR